MRYSGGADLNLKDLSYRSIVAALLVTVALLWGAGAVHRYATVDRPLAVLLEKHPEVADFTLSRPRGAPPRVEVRLRDVADLQRTYEGLTEGLQQVLGRHTLAIADTRTPDLVAFYAQAQFALQEAAQNGNFVAMQAHLAALASTYGIELRLSIGRERLYIQARSEHGVLYEIVSRLGNGGVSGQ